jgi:hypothetical protein
VKTTLEASCHCGAVQLEIKTPPQSVTDCNCSICRRYGALWAYYPPKDVRVIAQAEAIQAYRWGDQSIEFHRCTTCGCVTHWTAVTADADRLAVNARLMEPEVLRPLRVRKLDGAKSGKYFR